MKRRQSLLGLLVAGILLAVSTSAEADDKSSWVGELVINNKPPDKVRFGDVFDGKSISFPFSGRTPFKVREEREGRLRIFDGHHEGWADKDDFVLVRDAPAYFQRLVAANSKDRWARYMRGKSLLLKGEADNAIKDFDECIRLDPTDSAAFVSRGLAWSVKQDYDRAFKDYDEAIRLAPKSALAFVNRGIAWSEKQDYDRAIKDYDEARAVRFSVLAEE
jgi:tetratricopeptide (TPR) repeat protein